MKKIKLSEAIKLVEKHTGKKVILSPKKKTLKESLGSNTTKFIKELIDDKIAITKGQLLIIVNEFFENFETVSEFQIFDKKVKAGNKTVLTSLGKIISKDTGIVLTKVSKVLDSIMSNIEDVQEFKKVYIEVEKGLLGEFIDKNVPASIKGNYVASTNNAPKVNSPKVDTKWLDKMGIRNYTINSNGTVDVNGDVDISDKGLLIIPIQFRNVKNSFDCSDNNLTSLEGSPQKVKGNFYCYNNNLTSLQGSPQKVEGDFYCANNNLTNLQGSPKELGGVLSCFSNKLTSLAGVSWDKLSIESKKEFEHLKNTADGAKK